MYQPVTDRNGQVTGFTYTDAQGRQQFVPAVGTQQTAGRSPAIGGRLGGLMQQQRFNSNAFGGQSAAPQPGNGFLFGGNVTPPAPPMGLPGGAPQPGGQAAPRAGGGGSPLYQKFYGKFSAMGDELRGNVEAMAAGEPLGPTDAAYRAGDRRMRMDSRQAARDLQARSKAAALFANPYYAVDGVAEGTLGYGDQDYFRAQPLTQLAFLTEGAQGRDRWSDNARRFGQAVDRTAQQLGNGGGYDMNVLLGNLFSMRNNSALGRSFMQPTAGEARYDKYGIYQGAGRTTWDWAPATTQGDTMRSYLSAIYSQMPPNGRQPAMNYVNRLIDQWVAQNLNKKNAPPLYRWLGTQMGY